MGRRSKIFQWSLIILILVNVIIVITMIIKDYTDRPKHPTDILIEELHFTQEQTKQFEELSKDHFEAVRKNRKQMREAKDALFNAIDKDISPSELDSLTGIIGNLEKELDVLTYRHFSAVYKICTDEQRVKFNHLIRKALHKGGRENDGHRRPPPPRR